nr:hypothetical protein CFP56_32489 [Quercus suber]
MGWKIDAKDVRGSFRYLASGRNVPLGLCCRRCSPVPPQERHAKLEQRPAMGIIFSDLQYVTTTAKWRGPDVALGMVECPLCWSAGECQDRRSRCCGRNSCSMPFTRQRLERQQWASSCDALGDRSSRMAKGQTGMRHRGLGFLQTMLERENPRRSTFILPCVARVKKRSMAVWPRRGSRCAADVRPPRESHAWRLDRRA